jgi:2-keto-4-pentenoate hydratase
MRALLPLLALAFAQPALAACPDVPEVARLASAILDRRAPPAPRTDLSMADALCARERLVAVLAQPFGDQVGWKVGLTNPAAQARFRWPQPVAGAIFHGTLRERSGAELPARFGIAPAVESDMLVRIRDEGVNEAGDDPVALLRHIDAVIPFIELPDLVYGGDAPWSGPLLVSINAAARLGVMGEPIPAEATPEFAARLAGMTVTLREAIEGAPPHDTRELSRAPGSALLGQPLNALAWLVRELKEQGRRLRAGEHVSLGGFSPSLPVEAGRRYTATFEGLAASPVSVDVRFR